MKEKGVFIVKIAVYCGASKGTQTIYEKAAADLGKWLAKRNDTLVYGGGKAGLMGVVADAVIAEGGQTIGVMPTFLLERELAHPHLTEMLVVDSMSERKLKMFELSQAFIALPGGPGTLEEITEMVSWTRVGQNPYPCIFFNAGNYYAPIQQAYNQMVESGFLSQSDREKILFSDSFPEITAFIENYSPPVVRKY